MKTETVTAIEARGIACPRPVIMAEEALANITEGAVEILVDNEASVANLKRFATKNGFYPEVSKEDSHWRIRIVKGYTCDVPAAEATPAKEPEKDLLLIVASDVMGKDEALGKILMKGYFDTVRVTKELPHTIFFLNAGVKLTTIDETMVPVISELESMGVEIFSCGTCLKHFGLESSLKVGHRGTTNHIVEGMKDFRKTVWIG
ncbi:MAG TPA: sulfurtransferase-like selenium metabolism protein YedF [Dissulfurispiraceae bacterium]|nr:sulfurtransferase-like selenium metabolism protein YedF [Dissulfurispiraceae bacterium]